MNIIVKRSLAFFISSVFLISLTVAPAYAASPWAKEQTYWGKTTGKLAFGLKNTLLGWMTPWAESWSPKYKNGWEGFSAGMGKLLVNTGGGLVQLLTFYIPADFPDIGYGLPIPDPNRKVFMFQKTSPK